MSVVKHSYSAEEVSPELPLIELVNLGKYYGGVPVDDSSTDKVQPKVHVLHDICLSIHAGEFVAIVGTSGSGKSTLMNLLGCLDRPTSGQYFFAGKDVANFNSDQLAWLRRESFGFIFQSYHLIPSETAMGNVEVPALYAGLGEEARHQRAKDILVRLGMSDRLDYRPNQLSGGQQQRVSIARALMNGGCIILADEPTGALDTTTGAEVMALLEELADAGHTIILITHDQDVANQARRIIEICDGDIINDHLTQKGLNFNPINKALAPPDFAEVDDDKGSSLWASLFDAARAARRVMTANPIRTALTLLGIVIGVASVIVMLSIAEGAKAFIRGELNTASAQRMTLQGDSPVPFAPQGVITMSDVNMLALLPEVEQVEPQLASDFLLRHGNKDHQGGIRGGSQDFATLQGWSIENGRFFSKTELDRAAAVAVIGDKVKEVLFGENTSPLGRTILIGQSSFQIIGVFEKESTNDGVSRQDSRVVVPYTTAITRLFGPRDPGWVNIYVSDQYPLDHTEEVINARMLELHNGVNDFDLDNYAGEQEMGENIMGQMSLLVGAIAGISLLVGGIGVMNVMLMTVRERTREIGIRMATGARQRDIMRQFLTESVLLTVVGGVVGIGFSVGILLLVKLVNDQVPMVITAMVIGVAFGSAVVTGIVFGFSPASRAARLDPVVALSSE